MTGLLGLLLQCFGVRHRQQSQKKLPNLDSFPERPRIINMPYRNSMAGSMYFLGVDPALQSNRKEHHVGLETSSTKAIRFQPDMPTRASQLGNVAKASAVDNSVFVIASPGSVSPFSMNASPTSACSANESLQPLGLKGASGPPTRFQLPIREVRPLTAQQPKPGRPSLTVKIPRSTGDLPVQVYPSASSDSEGSLDSATVTAHTPAHARRLSAEGSLGACKKHEKTSLGDELASLSLSNSGELSPPTSAKL